MAQFQNNDDDDDENGLHPSVVEYLGALRNQQDQRAKNMYNQEALRGLGAGFAKAAAQVGTMGGKEADSSAVGAFGNEMNLADQNRIAQEKEGLGLSGQVVSYLKAQQQLQAANAFKQAQLANAARKNDILEKHYNAMDSQNDDSSDDSMSPYEQAQIDAKNRDLDIKEKQLSRGKFTQVPYRDPVDGKMRQGSYNQETGEYKFTHDDPLYGEDSNGAEQPSVQAPQQQNPSISPYQQGQLDLKKRELDLKEQAMKGKDKTAQPPANNASGGSPIVVPKLDPKAQERHDKEIDSQVKDIGKSSAGMTRLASAFSQMEKVLGYNLDSYDPKTKTVQTFDGKRVPAVVPGEGVGLAGTSASTRLYGLTDVGNYIGNKFRDPNNQHPLNASEFQIAKDALLNQELHEAFGARVTEAEAARKQLEMGLEGSKPDWMVAQALLDYKNRLRQIAINKEGGYLPEARQRYVKNGNGAQLPSQLLGGGDQSVMQKNLNQSLGNQGQNNGQPPRKFVKGKWWQKRDDGNWEAVGNP